MWRKTRQPYGARYGADPNRNFNYHFAGKFKKISIHYKSFSMGKKTRDGI